MEVELPSRKSSKTSTLPNWTERLVKNPLSLPLFHALTLFFFIFFIEVVIAPPALYLLGVKDAIKAPIQVSAQNAFSESSGAFTGEISPNQLKDADVHWVILGHSERRALFGDSDKLVADKVKAALGAGLSVIACIGETLEQRENGTTKEIVEKQLTAIEAEIKENDWP